MKTTTYKADSKLVRALELVGGMYQAESETHKEFIARMIKLGDAERAAKKSQSQRIGEC